MTESEKTDAGWDDHAATWDDREETHTYADRAFATLEPVVAEHLGAWDNLRVLDFGAGTGLLTERLTGHCHELVALDLSPKMIEVLQGKVKARGWTNVTTVAGELVDHIQSPELGPPFDLIVASSVCSFLPDFPAEVARLGSMLRPGGVFVQWDWLADEAGDWSRGFAPRDIIDAYGAASLKVISVGKGFVFSFEDNEMVVLQGIAQRPVA